MSGHFVSGLEFEDKARIWSNTCQYEYDSLCICNPAVIASCKEQHRNGCMRFFYGERCIMADRPLHMDGKTAIWYLGSCFLWVYQLSIPAIPASEAAEGKGK